MFRVSEYLGNLRYPYELPHLWRNMETDPYPGSKQQRRWSDCADAQADLCLCCSHMANTQTYLLFYSKKYKNTTHPAWILNVGLVSFQFIFSFLQFFGQFLYIIVGVFQHSFPFLQQTKHFAGWNNQNI